MRRQRAGVEPVSGTVGTGWTLDAVIGAGGTATVYRAHRPDGREAAVKLMHEHLVGNWSRRFEREAHLLSRLKEPSVVELYEFGRRSGVPFLVLELLAGESLDRVRLPSALSARVAMVSGYAKQALHALTVVHARGILHRDLKPSNLFLTNDGALKVLDFGAAASDKRDLGKPDSLTCGLLGTPAFMSPEQARGRWDLVDERSDVWSLAATLFTLLSGVHVHPGRTRNEQLGHAMAATARPVQRTMPRLDPRFARVLDRALSYRREDRYQSAAAFREALDGQPTRLETRPAALPTESTLREPPALRSRVLAERAPLAVALALGFTVVADIGASSKPLAPPTLEPRPEVHRILATSAAIDAKPEPLQPVATPSEQPEPIPQQKLKPVTRKAKLPVPATLPSSAPAPTAVPNPVNPLDRRVASDDKAPLPAARSPENVREVPRELVQSALDVRN